MKRPLWLMNLAVSPYPYRQPGPQRPPRGGLPAHPDPSALGVGVLMSMLGGLFFLYLLWWGARK